MQNGSLLATPFLDISSLTTVTGERGLLSIAFHPLYASNGYFFLYYTNLAGDIVIERRQVSGNANVADPVRADHPHHSPPHVQQPQWRPAQLWPGWLPVCGHGRWRQRRRSVRQCAKHERAAGQAAAPGRQCQQRGPAACHSAGQSVCHGGRRPEIWAYGCAIRGATPSMCRPRCCTSPTWTEQPGRGRRRPAGQAGNNYGWNIMEGAQCYNSASCNQAGLVLPVIDYGHDSAGGCSITGGYVYRGAALPELAGQYLYSDYCSGWLKKFQLQQWRGLGRDGLGHRERGQYHLLRARCAERAVHAERHGKSLPDRAQVAPCAPPAAHG
jgi:hypothetical protein